MSCGCGQRNCSCSLSALIALIKNAKDSEIAVLCTSQGVPVIVQYEFSTSNPEGAAAIPYMAWNVDGTPFQGNVADLVACSGGGGGGGIAYATYPICDNGTTKFVQLCGTDCGEINITYVDKLRIPTTAPSDWSLVSIGACDLIGEATLTRLTVTASGTIAAGKYSVAISNIGSAAGVVDGQTIAVGQSINMTAIDKNNTLYLLPAITYDGTGTTLSITTMEV